MRSAEAAFAKLGAGLRARRNFERVIAAFERGDFDRRAAAKGTIACKCHWLYLHRESEEQHVVHIGDLPVGLSICEDLWNDERMIPRRLYHQNPIADLQAAGARVLVNASASPFVIGKHDFRIELFAAQARARPTLRKRLWRQLVRSKIRAQAAALESLYGTDAGLRRLVARVRSGDPSNVEARAARRYWPRLFADGSFRRNPDNQDQNLLLNYGYAVLRAIVARAVCAAGLHPSLPLHHHNRYNAYCLADDLMEPFRPTVDRAVVDYVAERGPVTLIDGPAKQHIIGELTGRYLIDGQQRTIFDVAARLAVSLADAFLGRGDRLELPNW